MAQPTSFNKTFDTSLIDTTRSFSSTETNTSGSDGKEGNPPGKAPARPPSPFQQVPTAELYEKWASTYDHDGNILQFVDDLQMVKLLPEFVRLTEKEHEDPSRPIRILDLGCGTGRNTVKLLQAPWRDSRVVEVHGWDSSTGMLDIARAKCEAIAAPTARLMSLEPCDISSLSNVPETYRGYFDGVISTLVLEHIQAETFFSILAYVLKPSRAFAVVTNMHPQLGAISRAGFKTASGERFKGTSFIHDVQSTVAAAEQAGLKVEQDAGEMAVEAAMIDGGVVNGVDVKEGSVAERAKKYVGTRVWFGMVFAKP